jgi:hypothetical protein
MSFEVNRLRRSDWIVGGGGVALFVFMFFFKWFGGSVKGVVPVGGSVSYGSSSTGWDTFTNSRWIWLITIIVALGAVVLVATARKLSSPIQPSVIVAGLGALSTLLILYRIIHHPHGSSGFAGVEASYGIKIGIWLGLIAAAAITYGGYLEMKEEGTSLADVRDQAGRAVESFTEGGGESGSSTGAQEPRPSGGQASPAPPSAYPPTPPSGSPLPPPTSAPPEEGSQGEPPFSGGSGF